MFQNQFFFLNLRRLCLALPLLLFFAGCSSDGDDPDEPEILPEVLEGIQTKGNVLIVSQGNQGNKVAGELDLYSVAYDSVFTSLFAAENGFALGYTPENAAILGDDIYVAVFDENLVQIVDKQTLRHVGSQPVESPQCVVSDGTYVYAASNSGFIKRFRGRETAADSLYVGPNPMGLAVSGDYVYCSVSDAYNWEGGYANGKRVAKISRANFSIEKEIAVGINPNTLVADGAGNIFLVCSGNFADVPSRVWKITSTDEAVEMADGAFISARNGVVYIIKSESDYSAWPTVSTVNSYAAYSADGTARTFNVANGPAAPTGIFADPYSDRVYITADAAAGNYSSPGRLYVCDSAGRVLSQKRTGIHPYSLIFVQ